MVLGPGLVSLVIPSKRGNFASLESETKAKATFLMYIITHLQPFHTF